MNNTIDLDSLRGSDPIDTITFDESKDQAIDLTEVIDYDKQTNVNKMVDGLENLVTNGVLDLYTAATLGWSTKGFEPFPSTYNTKRVEGNEGFFSTVLSAIETGILTVIRFIKKIVMWCYEKVRYVFGFSYSERQAGVISDSMPEFTKEMTTYLNLFGLSPNLVNFERYLTATDSSKRRFAQLKLIASKLVNDKAYFENLQQILPMSEALIKDISNQVERTRKARIRVKDQLDKLFQRAKNHSADLRGYIDEVNSSILGVVKGFEYSTILAGLKALLEKSSGISASDEQIKTGIVLINQQIQASITTIEVNMNDEFVSKINQAIAKANSFSLDRANKSTNIIKDTLGELFNFSSADEVTKIRKVCELVNDNTTMTVYSKMVSVVQDYTNFTKAIMEILRINNESLRTIDQWYSNTAKLFVSIVADDVVGILEVVEKAKEKHAKDEAYRKRMGQPSVPFALELDSSGNPLFRPVMMSDADAKTAMEKVSTFNAEAIKMNILDVKNSINNFARSCGWGKMA